MSANTDPVESSSPADLGQPVLVRAHSRSVRKLGHWTAARRFDVRASRGSVILDLRSPGIAAGEIEIEVDVDHAMLKLLVPDDARVDDDGLRRVGRCGLADWGGIGAQDGRVIRITGELRSSELRVNRGGIAIVSAVFTSDYLDDLRRAIRENRIRSLKDVQRAYGEGRWTTIDDPGRPANEAREETA